MNRIILAFSLLCLFGCGHNRYNEYKTWGLAFQIPVGDLGSLGVCLGSMESSTAMVRGGSSFNSQTLSGSGLFAGAGGTAKVTTFRANEQLNEGNIVKIMEAPEVPDKVKEELAKNIKADAPDFDPSAMQVREGTLYSNGYNRELTNQFQPTGVDKVVEEVTSTTEHLADDLTGVVQDANDKISETVHTVSDHLNPGKKISETITNVGDNLTQAVTRWLIIIGSVLIFLMLIWALGKKRASKPRSPSPEAPKPPEMAPDPNEPDLREEMEIHTQEMPFTSQASPSSTDESEVSYPISYTFQNMWYGFLELLKSLLFFWKDLDPETRSAAIEAGKEFLKKDKKKDEDK